MTKLEGAADRPVAGRLALRFVSEAVGPARGEGEGPWWEVELGNAAPVLAQMNHQRRPPKGWGVVLSLIQWSDWRFSPDQERSRVGQAHPGQALGLLFGSTLVNEGVRASISGDLFSEPPVPETALRLSLTLQGIGLSCRWAGRAGSSPWWRRTHGPRSAAPDGSVRSGRAQASTRVPQAVG